MDPLPAKKRCICCNKTLPASAFLVSRYYPDKLTPRCRTCVFTRALRIREERAARAPSSAVKR